MGHIIQWTEDGDLDATTIRWQHLLLAGYSVNERPEARGLLWIQTDMSSNEMHRGEMKRFGNNQMLACDPATGEARRCVAVGRRHCLR